MRLGNGTASRRSRVRGERPQDYLKVLASILPKEVDVNLNENYVVLPDMPTAEEWAAEFVIEH